MYWLFCCHLGVGVTQNSDATLIHYVTEGKLGWTAAELAQGLERKVHARTAETGLPLLKAG